jgi:hypothetical protein
MDLRPSVLTQRLQGRRLGTGRQMVGFIIVELVGIAESTSRRAAMIEELTGALKSQRP